MVISLPSIIHKDAYKKWEYGEMNIWNLERLNIYSRPSHKGQDRFNLELSAALIPQKIILEKNLSVHMQDIRYNTL